MAIRAEQAKVTKGVVLATAIDVVKFKWNLFSQPFVEPANSASRGENIFLDQTFSQLVALIERTGLQELGNGRPAGPRVRGPFEVPHSSPMGRINRKPFDGPLDVLIVGPGCP